MNGYASGGYLPGSVYRVSVYDHGDHRSLTPTHEDGYCDRVLTYEESRALGHMALAWIAANATKEGTE